MEIIRFILFCAGFIGVISFLVKKCHFSIAISPLVAILSTTFLLYLFAICGFLKIGLYIILAIWVLLGILAFIKIKGWQEDPLPLFPLTVLVIILIGIFFYTRGALFWEWDEFKHWGVVFRYLMTTDQLPFQTARGVNVVITNYPPFSALFEYMAAKVIGFSESNAYFAFMLMEYLAIYSLFPLKDGKSWGKYLILFLSALVSVIAFGLVFQSLYVDLILGLLFAAGILYAYTLKSESFRGLFPVLLICVALILLKPTGIFFALVIIGLYLFLGFYRKHKLEHQKTPTAICKLIFSIQTLLLLLIPIATNLSWSLYSRNYPSDRFKLTLAGTSYTSNDINPVFRSEYRINLNNSHLFYLKEKMLEKQIEKTVSIEEIFRSFTANAPYRTKLISSNFFMEISSKKSFSYISTLVQILLILVISLINRFFTKKMNIDNKFSNSGLNILLFLGFIFYSIFLYLSYIFIFTPSEAITAPSLGRYLGSYLIGWWLVNLSLTNMISFKIKDLGEIDFGKYFSILVIACGLLVVPLENIIHLAWSPVPYRFLLTREAKTIDSIGLTEKDKIFIVQQSTGIDNGLSFYIARYLLTPTPTNIFGYQFTNDTEEFAKSDIEISPADWLNLLNEKNYTYVFVLSSDHSFWNTYQGLFDSFEDKNIPQFFKVSRKGLLKVPLEFGITEEMMKVYYP